MMRYGAREIYEGVLIIVVGAALWDVTRDPLSGLIVMLFGAIYICVGAWRMISSAR